MLFNNIKNIIKQKFCKHLTNVSSSCPFTGNTYTYCEKCEKRLKVEKTNN